MSDVKLGAIEQRQNALERRLDALAVDTNETLKEIALQIRTLAEDMHRIATFEFRVGALERQLEKIEQQGARAHDRIDGLDRKGVATDVRLGGGERLFWVVTTAIVGVIAAKFTGK